MAGLLSWIDHDPAERQRAQRILSLFQEKSARDELGLGALRDGLADHLFPGTSTIQTRLRYMLFVPWMYRYMESKGTSSARMKAEGRKFETHLIEALISAGESEGLIGKLAKGGLKRLPSSVYWNGLGVWGIRVFQGSQEDYYAFTDKCYQMRRAHRKLREEEEDSDSDRLPPWVTWRDVPDPPEGFLPKPLEVSFTLHPIEAEYLSERILHSCSGSLLADLVRRFGSADVNFVWEHPKLGAFRPDHRKLVEHGRLFSEAMHPAAILYNLILAELSGNEQYVEKNMERWREWADDFSLEHINAWDIEDFLLTVRHPNHTVSASLRTFVETWVDLLRRQGANIYKNDPARLLVKQRELRLKGPRSRFSNVRAREATWTGDAGVSRFDFRWRRANSFLTDLENTSGE